MCECGTGRTARFEGGSEPLMPEIDEMAAAAELLDAPNEATLDKVLATTISDAARHSGGALPPATTRILREIVKRVLRRVLPTLGRAPRLLRGRGGYLLPPRAGRILGIELEGLSPEDMELASARRAVRFARSAAHRASHASRRLPPRLVARRAALGAARRWAPAFFRMRRLLPRLLASRVPRPRLEACRRSTGTTTDEAAGSAAATMSSSSADRG